MRPLHFGNDLCRHDDFESRGRCAHQRDISIQDQGIYPPSDAVLVQSVIGYLHDDGQEVITDESDAVLIWFLGARLITFGILC